MTTQPQYKVTRTPENILVEGPGVRHFFPAEAPFTGLSDAQLIERAPTLPYITPAGEVVAPPKEPYVPPPVTLPPKVVTPVTIDLTGVVSLLTQILATLKEISASVKPAPTPAPKEARELAARTFEAAAMEAERIRAL